jgi:hypothetical protein
VHATSTIMIAKAIAAICLTASTAGGIALATTSTPATPHPRTTSESAAAGDVHPSARPLTTPGPDDTALADPDGTADASDSEPSDRTSGAGPAAHPTPAAKAPHPTGLCQASSNVTTDGHPGKAADSPAFTDLHCDNADTDADTNAKATRPTGRPSVAPGNPDRRTGKPDTASRPKDGTDTATKPEKATTPDQPADDHATQARADNGNLGKSSQHRRTG